MAKVTDIFQCKRCGYCCHGETTVSLDDNDQENMARVLAAEDQSTREAVSRTYWRITQSLSAQRKPIVQMKTIDGCCIFYQEEGGLGGCRVHTARPWRCGQWPLHPSILGDENNFQTIKASCPGINQEIDYQQFCTILQELMADGRIRC